MVLGDDQGLRSSILEVLGVYVGPVLNRPLGLVVRERLRGFSESVSSCSMDLTMGFGRSRHSFLVPRLSLELVKVLCN